LEEYFEDVERIGDRPALFPAEFGQFSDQPRLALFTTLEQGLVAGGVQGKKNPSAICGVIGPLDPAPALERVERLLHGLRPDLVSVGQGSRRHRAPVIQPNQYTVLGRRRGILVAQEMGAALDQPDDGTQPGGGIFEIGHIISITDDKYTCR